ncbi:MAG TPA: dihydrofolate reductase family protein [Pyrinomonadaceae bacterium]|nr:dihydrofolate reductase family protein [Pyrinomonadaceae bacterium]
MRKVTFGAAVSLDNFIAADNDAMDWLLFGDGTVEVMNEYWPRIDTILMGRKTWEVSRQNAPPESSSVDGGGIATYVFSRTLTPDAAPGATVISENAGDFVRELKSQPGKEICMMGGGDLARSLFEADVIDEVGLNIHPVILGSGVPLFHLMGRRIELELLECRPFQNGCVYVIYRVKH